ncbi:MAG TPA: EcsC family protein [Jiangellaceae bacterium]|nr:EcsC family protein [Jiangellaceae bacterium]
MSFRRTVTNMAGSAAARRAAPAVASRGVRQFLSKAVDGFPGFPGAREIARKHLARTHDVDAAVKAVIDQHVRLAGAQGFVTNLGGVVTLAISIPTNLVGLAILHVRMVAAIAHLRGYEISAPQVRAAALMTLLGEDGVRDAIKDRDLDSHPHDFAVGAGDIDPATLDKITAQVTQALVTRIGGKNATLTITRRVPIIGGAISAGVDALATHSVGRYADKEFPPHIMIERA